MKQKGDNRSGLARLVFSAMKKIVRRIGNQFIVAAHARLNSV
jgi:hypothetical protein